MARRAKALSVALNAMLRACLSLALFFTSQAVSPKAHASAGDGAQVRIALVGDPQIGYGDVWSDYLRFNRVVDAINRNPPDFVIIPGDLVEVRSPLENWLFARTNAKFQATVLLAPGNHDVIDPSTLDEYRRRFGPDYYTKDAGPVTLVVINSETARTPALSQTEYHAQWSFIERALQKSTAERKQAVLVMHRPPFAHDEGEEDSDGSWPSETRMRLLAACRNHGVRLILAGHLHRSRHLRTDDGIEIRVLAGTARSFDRNPIGFDEIILDQASHRTQFHSVGPPPHPSPPSIPGMRDWTPRLLDFSWGHWFFTLVYLAVGLSCRNLARRTVQENARSQSLWVIISFLLFFFALNTQLDLDELLRSFGRVMAKATGVSGVRHLITGTGLLILILAASTALLKRWRAGTPRDDIVALAALTVPCAWFILSTISHHDIGMLFGEFTWDVLTLISLATIFFASRRRVRA